MNGRDWLRRQRRPKYATGGLVTPGGVSPLEPGPAPYVVPAPRLDLNDAEWPSHQTVWNPPVEISATDFERLLRLAARNAPANCPCVGIYSHCYNPDHQR